MGLPISPKPVAQIAARGCTFHEQNRKTNFYNSFSGATVFRYPPIQHGVSKLPKTQTYLFLAAASGAFSSGAFGSEPIIDCVPNDCMQTGYSIMAEAELMRNGLLSAPEMGVDVHQGIGALYFARACEQGIGEGCFQLARWIYYFADEDEKPRVRVTLKSACESDFQPACELVGDLAEELAGGENQTEARWETSWKDFSTTETSFEPNPKIFVEASAIFEGKESGISPGPTGIYLEFGSDPNPYNESDWKESFGLLDLVARLFFPQGFDSLRPVRLLGLLPTEILFTEDNSQPIRSLTWTLLGSERQVGRLFVDWDFIWIFGDPNQGSSNSFFHSPGVKLNAGFAVGPPSRQQLRIGWSSTLFWPHNSSGHFGAPRLGLSAAF